MIRIWHRFDKKRVKVEIPRARVIIIIISRRANKKNNVFENVVQQESSSQRSSQYAAMSFGIHSLYFFSLDYSQITTTAGRWSIKRIWSGAICRRWRLFMFVFFLIWNTFVLTKKFKNQHRTIRRQATLWCHRQCNITETTQINYRNWINNSKVNTVPRQL